jgi:hypothetical protein
VATSTNSTVFGESPPLRAGSRSARILGALRGRYLTVLTLVYFAVTSSLMAWAGAWPTPDKVAIFGVLLALLVAKPLTFLKDWIPFVFLFLAYEYLRGLVPLLGWTVHVDSLIRADELLFGQLPMITLQNLLWVPDRIPWYDWVFTLTYLLHFALPLGFALLLWVRDRTMFRRFLAALVVVCFAGFFTYLFYPAMPPWMAASQGLIPPVHDVMARTLDPLLDGPGMPTLYFVMSPNLVAAMPSLHAAFPMMVYLFAVKAYGRKGHLFLPYLLTVWVGVVYTNNHWVIDVIAGAVYALVVFAGTELFWRRRERAAAARAAVRPEGKTPPPTAVPEPAAEGVAPAE